MNMDSPDLCLEILEKIAAREGVGPMELEVQLQEVIDVDALEAITTTTGYRTVRGDPCVEFMYLGYTVTVEGGGNVSIADHSPKTDLTELSPAVEKPAQTGLSAELERREEVLEQASAIMGNFSGSFDTQVQALLEVARNAVETNNATFSYVDANQYVFEAVDVPDDVDLRAGVTVPLEELPNCERVVETEQALVLADVGTEAPELADPTWGVASYLGVPVFLGGEVYGTLCFYEMEARTEDFSGWDLTFVELLSTWVSAKIEQRERERSCCKAVLERDALAEPEANGTWEFAQARR